MITRWLYSILFYLATPLLIARLFQRAKLNPAYRQRISERFGFYSTPKLNQSLWFHTVSVGEFIAAKALIDRTLAQYPDYPIVITTMTPTGSARVLDSYQSNIANGQVIHVYLPYDLPDAITRFLNRFNPKVLVIMETELWPNTIHYASRRNIPILVANARLSEKSAAGYAKVLPLFRPMMREVSLIAAQSRNDGERFIDLGLPPASLKVTGTIKFDLAVSSDLIEAAEGLRQQWGGHRKVFIAASTHQGEDEKVVESFLYIRSKIPEALLVLVPRHPERFDAVADLVNKRGLTLSRISQQQPVSDQTCVILGDTMGDLMRFLGASDVAFMGGSLEPVGGHNMLEALAMGTPVISGPHVFNFQMVAQLLTELKVLTTVSTPLGLGQAVVDLFEDDDKRQSLSARGKQVVEENRGAVNHVFDLICGLIADRSH